MPRQLTVAAPPPLASHEAGSSERRGWRRRAGRLPLRAHAVALGLVLVALVPLVGTGASFSADEGAAIVQARHLSRGQGWVVGHPVPGADPTGRNYPLELSTRGPRGTAPFVKHPLYALLLAGADRLGGVTAMVLLSVAGTVAAAVLAAALAGRLRPGLARPSLWAVGLASPLLFDGYLVIAHTLGAALAAGAVVCALRGLEGRGRPAVAVAGVAGCMAVAVLLRNEAVFWGLALGVAVGAFALRRRSRVGGALAVGSVLAAAAAHLGEQAWIGRILGGDTTGVGGGVDAASGFLADRVHSLTLTWLRPSYGGAPGVDLALVLMVAALVAGVVAARRHPEDRRLTVVLGGGAAGAAVAALAASPTNLVPGLLVATPLVAAGLVAVRRSTLALTAARLALATFGLFAAAVAATQYASGGSGEFGGRYFALGVPVLVPVVLLALADLGAGLDRVGRRAAVGALAVCSLVMSAMGLASMADTHRFTERLVATADRVGRATGDGRPVMVATRGAVPRLAWGTFDRQRWLLAEPEGLQSLVMRLRGEGVERVALVTDHAERDTAALGPGAEVLSRARPRGAAGWQVLFVRTGT